MSALSVFSETIGARLLIVNSVIFLVAMAGVIATAIIRLGLGVGVPGWATNVVGILVIIMLQTWMLTVLFCFGILGGRQATSFIPRRDLCVLRRCCPDDLPRKPTRTHWNDWKPEAWSSMPTATPPFVKRRPSRRRLYLVHRAPAPEIVIVP